MVVSFCLMIANLRLTVVQTWRARLSALTIPALYTASAPTGIVDFAKESLVSRYQLQKENSELRAQQVVLNAQLQKFLALQNENLQLRALLDATPPQGGRMMVAQLLAVAQDPYVQTIQVDKGSRYQVTVGQPVLDAKGIMGQVIEASLFSSRVLLLTDPRSAIPVQIVRSGDRGMAVGDGASGYVKLMHIPQTTEVLTGDVLVTSGLGKRYPAGYPVGTVVSVVRKPGDPFSDITVKPVADVYRTRLVLLYWLDENDKLLPPLQPLLKLLPKLTEEPKETAKTKPSEPTEQTPTTETKPTEPQEPVGDTAATENLDADQSSAFPEVSDEPSEEQPND